MPWTKFKRAFHPEGWVSEPIEDSQPDYSMFDDIDEMDESTTTEGREPPSPAPRPDFSMFDLIEESDDTPRVKIKEPEGEFVRLQQARLAWGEALGKLQGALGEISAGLSKDFPDNRVHKMIPSALGVYAEVLSDLLDELLVDPNDRSLKNAVLDTVKDYQKFVDGNDLLRALNRTDLHDYSPVAVGTKLSNSLTALAKALR